MASMPPVAVAAAGSSFNFGAFFVQLGASYLLGRLTAQDGPRLGNLEAAGGEYGVAIPRVYGAGVRLAGIELAMDDIKETEHTVEDYSELVGAATGAIQGFMMGGPVGAVIGGAVGGLLGFAAPDQKYYTYSVTRAVLFADRTDDDPIEGITKLWAGGKVIFNAAKATLKSETIDSYGLVRRKYKKNRYFKSLTIYGGGPTQGVDPVLAATLDEDSGYRHWAYAVIEDLQLARFGNAPPTIEGLIVARSNESLATVAEAICAPAGIDPLREMSSTALLGRTVRGYSVTTESTCWDALKPLLPVFGVDAAEVSGQIRFYRRSQSLRAIIPLSDMGAHEFGSEAGEAVRFNRSTDIDLPRETSFTFSDPERDYQSNTAAAQRSEGNAHSNVSVSVSVTLTASEGASVASTLHWDAWLGRNIARFDVTDKWIGIEPGVAYGIPVAGSISAFRITRKTRGANGIIECEAVSDESVTYQAAEVGTSGTMPDEDDTEIANTRIVPMDMPIFSDAHDDYGFLVAMAGSAPHWPRGRIQASGNGTVFATVVDDGGEAIIGDVTGTLAAGSTTGLDDTLDATSVLTVVLLHDGMSLSSATDAELDAFANFAFVGKNGLGEYLQFKTATKIAPKTWQLTNLRRGRKGTDHAIGTHASGEEFVLLGGSGVYRIVYSNVDTWGTPLTLRGLTLHQDEEDATLVPFTNTGEGKRPLSPVNVTGTWDGSNNLTITWESRSRLNAGGLGVDDNAEWDVEFTSGTPRSLTVTAETAIYTAAQQISDGLTPGDSITGRVRQTSDVNDGRWRNFTLIGPAAVLQMEDDLTALHLEDDTTFMGLE